MTDAKRELVAPRFWAKVRKTDTCWFWTAAVFKGRFAYGLFKLDGRCRKAHRVAYELERGRIRRGLVLLHACDNRLCVYPAHLTPGTHRENMADMRAKGRSCCLEAKNSARITAAIAHEIRTAYMRGSTYRRLAALFGISPITVSDLMRGRTWVSLAS